ncbi:MAG TPA: N-acetyltransferase [Xanthobacteraceae bacterium]|nr:N-acetyltransferase [Xanthobacteraceae bacterium]
MSTPVITIREEIPFDVAAREALLDAALGTERFAKTAERLRDGRLPAEGLSLVASADGRLIGSVRLWNIAAGRGRPALLLGPLAVDAGFRCCGVGGELMRHALAEAEARGHGAVLLVGDAPYYRRFGFSAERTAALRLPGPYARERFLARELVGGALAGAHGLVSATGRRLSRPPARRFRALAGNDTRLASHAA